jgi:hypothetical protein
MSTTDTNLLIPLITVIISDIDTTGLERLRHYIDTILYERDINMNKHLYKDPLDQYTESDENPF